MSHIRPEANVVKLFTAVFSLCGFHYKSGREQALNMKHLQTSFPDFRRGDNWVFGVGVCLGRVVG
jgi:hypothetical protein